MPAALGPNCIDCVTEGSKSNIPLLRGRCTQHLRQIRGCDAHPAHMPRKCYAQDSRTMCARQGSPGIMQVHVTRTSIMPRMLLLEPCVSAGRTLTGRIPSMWYLHVETLQHVPIWPRRWSRRPGEGRNQRYQYITRSYPSSPNDPNPTWKTKCNDFQLFKDWGLFEKKKSGNNTFTLVNGWIEQLIIPPESISQELSNEWNGVSNPWNFLEQKGFVSGFNQWTSVPHE
jgi:hypothetical protein